MDLVISCLGNMGKKYEKNRHNIGFRVGEAIGEKYGFERLKDRFKSVLYSGEINGKKILLQFPKTFMNLSGEAVQPCLGWHKLGIGNLCVVYDDVDIPFGAVRFRDKGSAGTHNGMRSVIQSLGKQEFSRCRVGVGPVPVHWDIANFVLSDFTSDEETKLADIIGESLASIEEWIQRP